MPYTILILASWLPPQSRVWQTDRIWHLSAHSTLSMSPPAMPWQSSSVQVYLWVGCNGARMGEVFAAVPTRFVSAHTLLSKPKFCTGSWKRLFYRMIHQLRWTMKQSCIRFQVIHQCNPGIFHTNRLLSIWILSLTAHSNLCTFDLPGSSSQTKLTDGFIRKSTSTKSSAIDGCWDGSDGKTKFIIHNSWFTNLPL